MATEVDRGGVATADEDGNPFSGGGGIAAVEKIFARTPSRIAAYATAAP